MQADPFAGKKRIVIKIGSALLVNHAGTLAEDWLAALVADIAALRARGREVIVVSSGAVALGRGRLGLSHKAIQLPEKQAAASVGQIALAQHYQQYFSMHHLECAQLLLSIEDSETRRRYLNARNTMDTLLQLGVVPVVNENDTVATAEIRYGDNDRLAARIAQMVEADLLVLLSDVDGLYTANPYTDSGARHIPEVARLTQAIEKMGTDSHNHFSSGGMRTKLMAARMAVRAGCDMVICDGRAAGALGQLSQGARHTRFKADISISRARKRWLANHLNRSGSVFVDEGAAAALEAGRSLLAVGVMAVEGHFSRGDAVNVKKADGRVIAIGLINYSASVMRRICRCSSAEIARRLHEGAAQPVMHRDHLAMT